ncbi:MAG: hypothetical protein VX223_17015, partial [Myxococcota bacterium]|nr:hypothetical protein [Myxococcota bacterium]
FAGGGITPNRMCGGYDVEPGAASALGFPGTPLALIDPDGNTQVRAPQSIDIIYTAMSLLGLDDIYIPGQPGRILGITS